MTTNMSTKMSKNMSNNMQVIILLYDKYLLYAKYDKFSWYCNVKHKYDKYDNIYDVNAKFVNQKQYMKNMHSPLCWYTMYMHGTYWKLRVPDA
jgi:hypothetical protein